MTTLPKAKKFRLRRSTPLAGETPLDIDAAPQAPREPLGGLPAGDDADLFDNRDDGFADLPPMPGTAQAAEDMGDHAVTPGSEAEIEAIRREGLTGRQLRMARRVAQKHGLAPVSDFDAVRLLRKRGIDPLERSTMLELVIADARPPEPPPAAAPVPARDEPEAEQKARPIKLPQTVPKPQLPSTKVLTEESRAFEIRKIQLDITRRRRRKMALLVTRLAFFVLLPMVLAGYYYYAIATPLYATKSEFVIQKADSGAGAGGLGGMFSGTQFATTQDSITVQSYLQSRDAMLRLDQEVGFRSHFSQAWIDPIKRLPSDASMEDAYKLYKRSVQIGFDPTEGIIKMEVVAADPEVSAAFSLALLRYAEEQVDQLTQRLREDQMQGARDSFADAEKKMQEAQDKVLALQEKLGVLDPVSESSAVMSQVATFEVQLQQKRLELQQLLDNRRPNQARVDGVKGDIQRLENLIAELRSQLTTSDQNSQSLARTTGELRMAEVDLATRQMLMQAALQQLETARIEANRQVRYLSLGVSPVAPDEATYPRKFENTLLVGAIFAGIYLMISLTASILREQVTA
jgi:capsular polysaccharide transport system permease protein